MCVCVASIDTDRRFEAVRQERSGAGCLVRRLPHGREREGEDAVSLHADLAECRLI